MKMRLLYPSMNQRASSRRIRQKRRSILRRINQGRSKTRESSPTTVDFPVCIGETHAQQPPSHAASLKTVASFSAALYPSVFRQDAVRAALYSSRTVFPDIQELGSLRTSTEDSEVREFSDRKTNFWSVLYTGCSGGSAGTFVLVFCGREQVGPELREIPRICRFVNELNLLYHILLSDVNELEDKKNIFD